MFCFFIPAKAFELLQKRFEFGTAQCIGKEIEVSKQMQWIVRKNQNVAPVGDIRPTVERVMVNGEWCVIDAMHVQRDLARAAYAEAIANLGATQ